MSLKPILEALAALEEQIVHKEAEIQIYYLRIEQQRENFMLSHKIKTLNINILRKRIVACKKEINNLNKRITIISTT